MTQNQEVNESPKIQAGDKSKGAKYIAEHPEEYGFIWESGAVEGRLTKNGDLVELRKDAPKVNVRADQIELFMATFGPEQLAKAFNGVSPTVTCQRIARDTLIANRSTTNEQLKEKIVLSLLLNVIVRGPATVKEVRKFVANDGSEHDTLDKALAHNKSLIASTSDNAKFAAFLAACEAQGMEPSAAKLLWDTMHG
jgi:hypothetical protein